MTVGDLLTMRTGHDHETSGSEWRPLKTSWIAEFMKIPVVYQPGTKWVYTSAASYMLSAIVTKPPAKSLPTISGLVCWDSSDPGLYPVLAEGLARFHGEFRLFSEHQKLRFKLSSCASRL
jgi:hypothetical protein